MFKTIVIGAALAAGAVPATAAVNLVTNGGFEASSYRVSSEFGGTAGPRNYTAVTQGVTGWTGGLGAPLQFYFVAGTQNSVSALNRYNDSRTYFWPSFTSLSPNGGNFIALDGDVNARGTISQTVTGLTAGKSYSLTFDWAATQLRNRTGPTTDQIVASLGGMSQSTAVVPVASRGFSGWMTQTFTFRATSSTEALSFLAIGTPTGLPPIAVLDGVSLTAVPEASTWVMMVAGFGLVGFAARRRTTRVVAA